MSPLNIIAVIIVIIILYLLMTYNVEVKTKSGNSYRVAGWFSDKARAAECLDKIHQFNIKVARELKAHKDDHDIEGREYFIDNILAKYDPDALQEHAPFDDDSSYVVNKGEIFAMCLRDKQLYELHDDSILHFVALHELSHIGSSPVPQGEDSHTREFWGNFAWLLKELREAGIYEPVDYENSPLMFCGKDVQWNPYFSLYPEHAALTNKDLEEIYATRRLKDEDEDMISDAKDSDIERKKDEEVEEIKQPQMMPIIEEKEIKEEEILEEDSGDKEHFIPDPREARIACPTGMVGTSTQEGMGVTSDISPAMLVDRGDITVERFMGKVTNVTVSGDSLLDYGNGPSFDVRTEKSKGAVTDNPKYGVANLYT